MAVPSLRREGRPLPTVSLLFLLLSNILVFQLGGWLFQGETAYSNVHVETPLSTALGPARVPGPLDIPAGKAVPLPSVRVDDTKAGYDRNYYGGKGDKPHLGGFATGNVDPEGMSPNLWKWMIEHIGVKSLLDVRIIFHNDMCSFVGVPFFNPRPFVFLCF